MAGSDGKGGVFFTEKLSNLFVLVLKLILFKVMQQHKEDKFNVKSPAKFSQAVVHNVSRLSKSCVILLWKTIFFGA